MAPWASGPCKEPLHATLRPLSPSSPRHPQSMSAPRVACLSWAQQCLFTLMPAGRWLRDQPSWLVWEHPGFGTKNRQNHIEATEVGIACRRGSGGWKSVVGRLLESWEPSPPGLAWVLALRVWSVCGTQWTHTYCLCTPHAAAASLAEKGSPSLSSCPPWVFMSVEQTCWVVCLEVVTWLLTHDGPPRSPEQEFEGAELVM